MTEKQVEYDPHGLDPSEPGAKLDAGKIQADLLEDFGLALLAVADVATYGASKYSLGGWQEVKDGVRRYKGASWRHLLRKRYKTHDSSGLLHDAQVAWNVLAQLELKLRELRKQGRLQEAFLCKIDPEEMLP
jgi:hypothetical protein